MQCKAQSEKFANRKASKKPEGAALVARLERKSAERERAVATRRRRAAWQSWYDHIRGEDKDVVHPVEFNA